MKKLFAFLLFSLSAICLPAQQWVPILVNVPPGNFDYQNISVVNSDVVWALADSIYSGSGVPVNHLPAVIRTVDGGVNWDYFRVTEAKGRHAWKIQGIDANTAIFTTNQFNPADTRPIFKTTDGGLTWKKITPPGNSGGVLIHFFDTQNGVVINRHLVSTTSDGGETWTAIPAANQPTFASDEYNLLYYAGNFSAQVGDRIWVGTSKGRIYRTKDRGQHWDMKQVAGTTDRIISIAFSDSLNGVATAPYSASQVYQKSKLYRTEDGGDTWEAVNPAPMGQVTTIGAVPGAPNHYFAGSFFASDGSEPNISLNTNGLDLDAWQSPMPDSVYLNCLQFINPTVGYAAAWSSRVEDEVIINGSVWYKNYLWKWTGSVISETINLSTGTTIQLSPNPTSDVLLVSLESRALADFQITLRDMQGRQLDQKQAGHTNAVTVQFDLQKLPSGLYFIHANSSTGNVVRKVVKQ